MDSATTFCSVAAVLALCLTGCAAERTPDASAGATGPADTAATGEALSEADARRVLRAVYRPVRAFYQRMETTDDGPTRPPAGMRTPEALADTLAQTIAPKLARKIAGDLLMKRGDGYIVRATEKMLLPYEGAPALETVNVNRENNGQATITERYAPTELHGRVERRNKVRRQNGRWRLMSMTYRTDQR